jgi:hypothetical protein
MPDNATAMTLLNQKIGNQRCLEQMLLAYRELQRQRPAERSELARRYAVTITELEKVFAYFQLFVVDGLLQDAQIAKEG